MVGRNRKPPSTKQQRAWQDSNLRHTAPETVALSPELQARARVGTAQGCYRNVCGASTDGRAIEIVHPAYKLRRTLYVRGYLGHPRQPRGTRSRPWRRARGSGDYLLPWRCNRLRGEPGRVLRRGALPGDADDLGQPRPRRNRPGDGPELVQSDGRGGRAVDTGSLERGERQILAHEAAHDAVRGGALRPRLRT